MKKPNFFLIGAPKCGTTSIALYLSQHSNIFMCDPKEPYFYSTDINSAMRPQSLQEYEELFKSATSNHNVVGEASTTYLRSKVAVPAILNYNPDAKFLVCIRNPIEMVASVHSQLLKNGRETERSLERAWLLQNKRQKGKNLPLGCIEPADLQYGRMCLVGNQLERLFSLAKKENVHVLTLEDLKKNTRLEYRRVLKFLGVEDDGKSEFSVKNKRSVPISAILALTVNQISLSKRKIGFKGNTGVGALIQKINNTRKISKQNFPVKFKIKLSNYFKNDVKKIESILDRDFSYWFK